MPGPLDALKKAQTIQADPNTTWQLTPEAEPLGLDPSGLAGGLKVIKGLSHPAIKALVELLDTKLEPKDALAIFKQERIGRKLPPPAEPPAIQGFRAAPPKPPTAHNPTDASMIQEGHWDFGRSPQNAWRYSEQQRAVNRYDKSSRVGTGQNASQGGAKVTPDIVREIRAAQDPEAIATKYGLKPASVRGILSRDNWAWVK